MSTIFYPFFDPTMVILIPAIILSLYAQFKVQGTYAKYSRINSNLGITGSEAAKRLLNDARINNVKVEMVPGKLTDHYDPRHRILRLSPDVYNSSSLAALGIAAHETGHAIQHNVGYYPLELRNLVAPVAQIGSNLAFPILFIGLMLGAAGLIQIGIVAFALVVLFQIVTLPVEFNASNRAIAILGDSGILEKNEILPARKVLNAAALTYVAAAITAILTLLRFIILSGLLRRDE